MVQNTFKIKAGTYTLKDSAEDHNALLSDKTKYNIPIYQRPYSWGEEQLRKFISDLIHSFSGNDTENSEPVFIGTMQLSKPETIDNFQVFDVVDGQQRLTTILLLCKIFNELLSEEGQYQAEKLDWLKSEVSNNEQQKLLDDFLSASLEDLNDISDNIYIKNGYYLNEALNEKFCNENILDKGALMSFKDFILKSIYFVVIETHTGLSQTLKIFDSINTTGLDLNGGDIFKIKMYEYLTTKKGKEQTVFQEISNVYEEIDHYNAIENHHKIHINQVLDIYRFILVGRHELPKALMTDMSATVFFERLFDSILGLYEWKNFSSVNQVFLSIEDLHSILKALKDFNSFNYSSQISAACVRFISESRYRRYWLLMPLMLVRFNEQEYINESFEKFSKRLFQLFFLYSIAFAKKINDIDHFIYWDILRGAFRHDSNIDELSNKIRKKTSGPVHNYDHPSGIEVLDRKLELPLIENSTKKNLVCRLSAVLTEHDESSTFNPKVLDKVFDWDFDIEHIQSYNDNNIEEREAIKADWGNELNSLGNLIILERKHNRSIGNKEYVDKLSKYKISKYKIVKDLANSHPESWSKEDALQRREKETKKIRDFIFS